MFSILSNNFSPVNAAEAEQALRAKYPLVLPHKDEKVELAFKSRGEMGRDKQYLTTHRILIKDGKGFSGKRKSYTSIPYNRIDSFSVETAGGGFDTDVELHWTAKGNYKGSIDFCKDDVDIFAIQQFMNHKVFGEAKQTLSKQSSQQYMTDNFDANKIGTSQGFWDWMGDNAVQLDAASVQKRFSTETPVLMPHETVRLAFQSGRDLSLITNLRLLGVNTKGFSGMRIEFRTIPWSTIVAFSVETAGGSWDRDSEMRLFTSIPSKYKIQQDLRKGKVDLFAVQKAFCDAILGNDDVTAPPPANVNSHEGHVDQGSLWSNNNRPLDAVAMNTVFHSNPPILQPSESVELAFKGRRDIVLFTSKRLIDVDVKGWSGKSVEYKSVPWKSILGFGVRSAGGGLDNDHELCVWTEVMPETVEDEPDRPGMSMLELDFNKESVNILEIQRYLALRCMGLVKVGVPLALESVAVSVPVEEGLNNLLSWLGDDMKQLGSVAELNEQLHSTSPVLMESEHLVMAFKAGRDMTLFTNLRMLSIDTQGWSGKKKEYTSIPYTSMRGYAVESAGGWDRDSQVTIYTRNLWTLGKVKQDFRKGKADILGIQKFLSAMVLGDEAEAAKFVSTDPTAKPNKVEGSAMEHALEFLTDNTIAEDPAVFNDKLRTDPPLLLKDERVLKVYRQGRDLHVYTNLRYLKIDVQGFSGKKIEYFSVPNEWIAAFSVETAGSLDPDAEVYLACESSKSRVRQDIMVSRGDVMDMHAHLTHQLLFV